MAMPVNQQLIEFNDSIEQMVETKLRISADDDVAGDQAAEIQASDDLASIDYHAVLEPALATSPTTSPTLPFPPALSRSLSQTSLSTLGSRGCGGDPDAESDEEEQYFSDFEDIMPLPNGNVTAKSAKGLSVANGCLFEITNRTDDRIAEDERGDGLKLRGYLDGLPVYYETAGMYSELNKLKFNTILGLQYVSQPISSCFGKAGSGSDSDFTGAVGAVLPPNRTFANEWLAVKKSPLGGDGVFATKTIPQHFHFFVERPFLRLNADHLLLLRLAGTYQWKMNEEEKAVFDGMHGYHKNSRNPQQRKWSANSFYLQDSEGMFAIASNFNHACWSRRNAQYKYDRERNVMVFTSTRKIAEGDEILISYGQYRGHLEALYGFKCQCGGCIDG